MANDKVIERSATAPAWVVAIAILGAGLLCVGGVIGLIEPGMMVSSQDEINGAVHIYAGYFASRNLVLALLLVVLVIAKARRALGNIMVLVGLVQILDACVDVLESRWVIVPGVLLLGVAFLGAAAKLSGRPFWQLAAWK